METQPLLGHKGSNPATASYGGQAGPSISQQAEHPSNINQQSCSIPAGAVAVGGNTASSAVPFMDAYPEFFNVNCNGVAQVPPIIQEISQEPSDRASIRRVPGLTEYKARDALRSYVAQHCCYGSGPVECMQILSTQSSSVCHYILETFGESRIIKWTFEPYMGQGLIITGLPPDPWDMQVQTNPMFQPGKVAVEVPNTATVKNCLAVYQFLNKPCEDCSGQGSKTCSACSGCGNAKCPFCDGRGRVFIGERCYNCNGGWRRCPFCNGSARKECPTCAGRGNLRWFIQLTIKWTTYKDDHVVEKTTLPKEKFQKVSGEIAFEEKAPRIWPIKNSSDQEINVASERLINKHASYNATERILMQRHVVRIVPMTKVRYDYLREQHSYHVYGLERKVYAPDYPQMCYCCTVL